MAGVDSGAEHTCVHDVLNAADLTLTLKSVFLTFNLGDQKRRQHIASDLVQKFSTVAWDSGTITQPVMEMASIEPIPLKNTAQDYDSSLISMQMCSLWSLYFRHYISSLYLSSKKRKGLERLCLCSALIYNCGISDALDINQTHLDRISLPG